MIPQLGLLQVGVPDWIVFQQTVIPILGMGLGALAMFGVYRTINRALDRRHERLLASEQEASARELEEVRGRIEALEETAFRVQELEERVDFAERLLTREQHHLGSKEGG
ncbi:MAG: hypothetical protein JSW51_02085 [Gemmatimonadota bacterium]|nr:MAG: hypothetical protein JSW51_02085 [Gemmatimonadota bacterium]